VRRRRRAGVRRAKGVKRCPKEKPVKKGVLEECSLPRKTGQDFGEIRLATAKGDRISRHGREKKKGALQQSEDCTCGCGKSLVRSVYAKGKRLIKSEEGGYWRHKRGEKKNRRYSLQPSEAGKWDQSTCFMTCGEAAWGEGMGEKKKDWVPL